MQKYIIQISLLFWSFAAFAQQPAQYSLHMFNRMAYNPAYAGMDNSLSLTGVFRTQWVNLEGSPTSQHVNVHAPLPFLSSGFGLSFQNDELGAERNLSLTAAYNYQVPVGRSGTLSIGIAGGINQQNLNGAIIRTPDGEYTDGNLINHNDGTLPINAVAGMAPNIAAGIYYKSDVLEVGLAASNLLEQALELPTVNRPVPRAYFFNASANFDLGSTLSLHPSVFLKSDVLQTQIDFSVMLRYNDNISIGTSFRGYDANSSDALALIGGFRLSEKIRLYYSYDLTLSRLNTVSTGSHEILVNYNLNKEFGKGVPPQIIYNPRAL
ncbi:MAG: type IX secretion system membrane protein PorP/SprF [Bacteroidota bacterium]